MSKKVPSTLPLMTIDAFTNVPFSGNGAAICPVEYDQDIPEDMKQKIASEINLSETAYVQALSPETNFKQGTHFGLRWFTPTNEVALCGHATLAAAAALFKCMGNENDVLTFSTLSGDLYCRRDGDRITIDLPLNKPVIDDDETLRPLVKAVAGSLTVVAIYYSNTTRKLLIRLDDKYTRKDLESVSPDPAVLLKTHDGTKVKGIILTLKGGADNGCTDVDGVTYDFVSRYFAPWNGINEDPVTGSAHTVLGPFWADQLGKTKLYARQCSPRGGDLHVLVRDDDRVDVSGDAAVVIRGQINLQ